MSFIIQYIVLSRIMTRTFRIMQTPTRFRLPYSELHVRLFRGLFWRHCCVLEKMGFVEMFHDEDYLRVSVTRAGALFANDLKMQFVKAFCSLLLAGASAAIGFALGSL